MASLLEALLLAVGAMVALLMLRGLLRTARWSRVPLEPAPGPQPPVTILLPVRGEHHGLEGNLRALASQDYPDYDVVVIADSADDPAARVVQGLALPRTRLVLTDPAEAKAGWGSGKIAALVSGVAQARASSEVLVFADADVRPPARWLACLVAPLADARVGGVTGFQSYRAAGRGNFWTALRDAGASRAMELMMLPRIPFLWGGSMAVRRADFDRSAVREEWRKHVCDDVGLSDALRKLDLDLAFAPGAIVEAPEDWTRKESLDWLVRQYALARTINPKATQPIALLLTIAILGQLLGLALLLAWPSPLLGLAGLLLLAPTYLAPVRALLRERLVRRALGRGHAGRELALQCALALVLPWFMLWAVLRAGRVGAIAWRGRSYQVAKP